MKIAIGSDHGGFELKEYLKQMLAAGHDVTDVGHKRPRFGRLPGLRDKGCRVSSREDRWSAAY